MHRPNAIQITLPEPCHQKWEDMTPCGEGRHCAHCDKTVIDFTTWSDTALYEFFTKDQGKVCGRFHASQLSRDIHIPPQPYSRLYRMVVAMGLTLIFAQGGDVYGQSRPLVGVDSVPDTGRTSMDGVSDTGSIYGTVLDEKKQPIIGAIVQVLQGGTTKGGAVTDFDGNYKIKDVKEGAYTLVVQYSGYKKMTVSNILIEKAAAPVTQDIQMVSNGEDFKEVHLILGKPRIDMQPGRRVYSREDIKNMPIR